MVAMIDMDALKIFEQIRLKIDKRLRTASLNSKFTGSYKKKCKSEFKVYFEATKKTRFITKSSKTAILLHV